MKNLHKALVAQIAGSDFAGAITEFYNGEAPKGAKFPYAVFKILGVPKSYVYSAKIKEPQVKIILHDDSTSVAVISTIHEYLLAILDEQTFSIDDETMVDCVESNFTTNCLDGIWYFDSTFTITLQDTYDVEEGIVSPNVLWDLLGV